MKSNIHGWEYYDLEKEIGGANLSQLIELYKREDAKYTAKCVEFVDLDRKLSAEGKAAVENECHYLEGCKLKVALAIADKMTK